MHRGLLWRRLACCLLRRMASAPSPLSLARSLCVLARCPFSAACCLLPPSLSFLLRLLRWFLGCSPFSDRGRSRTSAAVDCCGVRVVGSSCHAIGASRTQGLSQLLLPSCQVGFPLAHFLSPFRAHSHSSPAWSLSPSILLAYSFSQPSHPTRLLL